MPQMAHFEKLPFCSGDNCESSYIIEKSRSLLKIICILQTFIINSQALFISNLV